MIGPLSGTIGRCGGPGARGLDRLIWSRLRHQIRRSTSSRATPTASQHAIPAAWAQRIRQLCGNTAGVAGDRVPPVPQRDGALQNQPGVVALHVLGPLDMVADPVEFHDESRPAVQAVGPPHDGANLPRRVGQPVRNEDLPMESPFQRALDAASGLAAQVPDHGRVPGSAPGVHGGDKSVRRRPALGQRSRDGGDGPILRVDSGEVQQRCLDGSPGRAPSPASDTSPVVHHPRAQVERVPPGRGPDGDVRWSITNSVMEIGSSVLAQDRPVPATQNTCPGGAQPARFGEEVQPFRRRDPLPGHPADHRTRESAVEELPRGEEA